MDSNTLRSYCLSKKGVVETFPFGDEVRVFKVAGKMFALLPVAGPTNISLKCEPTWAQVLRSTYPAVTPAYHMNKEHWNSVACDGSIPGDALLGMVDHSYERVVQGLTRKERSALTEGSV